MASTFFGLPREIRDIIYAMVPTSTSDHPISPQNHGLKKPCLDASLLRVNRQAHDEFIKPFLSLNVFQYTCDGPLATLEKDVGALILNNRPAFMRHIQVVLPRYGQCGKSSLCGFTKKLATYARHLTTLHLKVVSVEFGREHLVSPSIHCFFELLTRIPSLTRIDLLCPLATFLGMETYYLGGLGNQTHYLASVIGGCSSCRTTDCYGDVLWTHCIFAADVQPAVENETKKEDSILSRLPIRLNVRGSADYVGKMEEQLGDNISCSPRQASRHLTLTRRRSEAIWRCKLLAWG